jgi:hypothetical protein
VPISSLPRAPFLKPSKRHGTIRRRNIGLQELVFFIEASFTESCGFDDDFLPIRKKSICAGGLLGYSIKYNYKSTVYHVGGATLQQGNPKNIFKTSEIHY